MEEELFKKPEHRPAPPGPSLAGLATRIKLAEDRYQNLQQRNQLTENQLLELEKQSRAEIRALQERMATVRGQVQEMQGKIDLILGELQGLARKHEVAIVERYLDLWEPTRFVTREQAKRLVEKVHNG